MGQNNYVASHYKKDFHKIFSYINNNIIIALSEIADKYEMEKVDLMLMEKNISSKLD